MMRRYAPVQRTGHVSLFWRLKYAGWNEHSEPFFFNTFRTGYLLLRTTSATTTGNRLLGAFACARIGTCTLPTNGQITAMAKTAVASNLDQTLDVHLYFAAQVAFDFEIFGNVF